MLGLVGAFRDDGADPLQGRVATVLTSFAVALMLVAVAAHLFGVDEKRQG